MDVCSKILESSIQILGVIAWPTVTLIVFFILRNPLKIFISSIKKIEYGSAGIETEHANKQADGDDKSPIELLSKGASNRDIEKAINSFSDETMKLFEEAVKKETLLDACSSLEEKQDILLKYSQVLYLIMHFNKIYNSIYGSQLKLLQRLNSSFHESKDTLKSFYDFAKHSYPRTYESYSYENYLDFLQSFDLILFEDTDTVRITILGRDFLKYIIDTGLSLEKMN